MLMAAGCDAAGRAGGENVGARGSARDLARLSDAQRAQAYSASLRQAFELGPALMLLLDSRMLPASGGYSAGGTLPPGVSQHLRGSGVIQGLCRPTPGEQGAAPSCDAERAGYVIRFSEIFGAPGDTIRLYLTAERFRPRRDGARYASAFAMEERYSLVRRAQDWVVVRKERKRIT